MNKSTIGRTIRATAPALSSAAPAAAAWSLARLFTFPLKRPPSDRQRSWMASAERSSLRFDARRRLAVYAWGDGPTILLVHGWAGRASQLGLYAEPLVARGYRAVAFDAPSHGESEGRFSALPEFAGAVERVAAEVGPLAGVLAHSLGTAATTLALARGLSAGRLVYLAPPEDLPGYLARLAAGLGFAPSIAPRAQRILERRYGVPFEDARGSTLAPKMRAALLAFHDEGDRDVPLQEGQRLVRAWPGARLVTTRGLGHHRVVWAPRVVEEAVRFLTADARPTATVAA